MPYLFSLEQLNQIESDTAADKTREQNKISNNHKILQLTSLLRPAHSQSHKLLPTDIKDYEVQLFQLLFGSNRNTSIDEILFIKEELSKLPDISEIDEYVEPIKIYLNKYFNKEINQQNSPGLIKVWKKAKDNATKKIKMAENGMRNFLNLKGKKEDKELDNSKSIKEKEDKELNNPKPIIDMSEAIENFLKINNRLKEEIEKLYKIKIKIENLLKSEEMKEDKELKELLPEINTVERILNKDSKAYKKSKISTQSIFLKWEKLEHRKTEELKLKSEFARKRKNIEIKLNEFQKSLKEQQSVLDKFIENEKTEEQKKEVKEAKRRVESSLKKIELIRNDVKCLQNKIDRNPSATELTRLTNELDSLQSPDFRLFEKAIQENKPILKKIKKEIAIQKMITFIMGHIYSDTIKRINAYDGGYTGFTLKKTDDKKKAITQFKESIKNMNSNARSFEAQKKNYHNFKEIAETDYFGLFARQITRNDQSYCNDMDKHFHALDYLVEEITKLN